MVEAVGRAGALGALAGMIVIIIMASLEVRKYRRVRDKITLGTAIMFLIGMIWLGKGVIW